MILKKEIFWLLVFFISTLHVYAQVTSPQRVLFVGNSYTYFWNLPQNVALMAESKGINLKTFQSTSGGATLGHHWRYERKLKSKDAIGEGNFDIVILQDHSLRAIQHPDSLLFFGQLFGDLIKKTGAKPYVYMTWARELKPDMQEAITQKYTELAEQINAQIVPVGLAWQRARELKPDLDLYNEDGSHPSTLGTYLSACVFFGVLTQQSPVGLPNRLITTDRHGEKLYINIQSEENALFCQKVAAEVINKYND